MSYYTNRLLPFPAGITPKGTQIVDFRLAGLGLPLALVPAGPPQAGNAALLTHSVGASAGADCPTCNLVEIPYNPNLPVLNYTE
jgi:hypothetical protein